MSAVAGLMDDIGKGGSRSLETNPLNIRESSVNWISIKKTRFETADKFYNKVGFKNYDNYLRGIDFNNDVKYITLNKDEFVYQYCYLDDVGNPKIGSYFYKKQDIDVSKLGFDIESQVMIKAKLKNKTEFLESTAANIEDWAGSSKIFEGGETQFFSPNVELYDIIILTKPVVHLDNTSF